MNTLTRHCLLVALFALLLEVIDTGEAYRLGRYRKSYSKRRPWYPPRRHTDRGSSKVYHSKRTPSEDYYSHRPADYSYHTGSDEYDGQVETKPYTIIIHLPKGERYGHNDYLERNKKYERDPISVFSSENDYIDETEDVERDYRDTKVVNVNNKKVQIKMIKGERPQLHIKISRSDDENDITFIDKSTITAMDLSPTTYENLTLPAPQSYENWTSLESTTIYPEDFQMT